MCGPALLGCLVVGHGYGFGRLHCNCAWPLLVGLPSMLVSICSFFPPFTAQPACAGKLNKLLQHFTCVDRPNLCPEVNLSTLALLSS